MTSNTSCMYSIGIFSWNRSLIELTKMVDGLRHFRGALSACGASVTSNPFRYCGWPDNVWMGVTVESEPYLRRVDRLRQTGAAIKFLSLEPLRGPLPALDLTGIDWGIVGGESGAGARPMAEEWVWEILSICREAQVPFFFKQWGTRPGIKNKKAAGRLLGGETYDEMPEIQ